MKVKHYMNINKRGEGLHLHCAFTLYISSFFPILISVYALLQTGLV